MAALFIFDELQRRDISKQLVFRDRRNHLDYLTDGKIRERYRLPRLYLLQLVALVSCDLKNKNNPEKPTYLIHSSKVFSKSLQEYPMFTI